MKVVHNKWQFETQHYLPTKKKNTDGMYKKEEEKRGN